MKTRVTITLDLEAHRRAKQTDRERRTTVSGLIETLLETAATPMAQSIVDQMIGSATLRAPATGTDPLYDILASKLLKP